MCIWYIYHHHRFHLKWISIGFSCTFLPSTNLSFAPLSCLASRSELWRSYCWYTHKFGCTVNRTCQCFVWKKTHFSALGEFCQSFSANQHLLATFLAVQNSSIGDIVPWSLGLTELTIRVFTSLQSNPTHLWPLGHLIKVTRRHDLTKKDLPTYIPTYLPFCQHPLENTLKEQS